MLSLLQLEMMERKRRRNGRTLKRIPPLLVGEIVGLSGILQFLVPRNLGSHPRS
jgi:hypothetical protein